MIKTLKFFTACQTIPEVKTEYKRLVKIYHPDLAGDTIDVFFIFLIIGFLKISNRIKRNLEN